MAKIVWLLLTFTEFLDQPTLLNTHRIPFLGPDTLGFLFYDFINKQAGECLVALKRRMEHALQISGWVEIMTQALLLLALLYYWVNHPKKKWIAWVLGIIYVLVWVFGIMGVVFA